MNALKDYLGVGCLKLRHLLHRLNSPTKGDFKVCRCRDDLREFPGVECFKTKS